MLLPPPGAGTLSGGGKPCTLEAGRIRTNYSDWSSADNRADWIRIAASFVPGHSRGRNGSASHLFSGCRFAEGVLNSASKTKQCISIFITE